MKRLFEDTSPQIEQMMIEGYRRMSPLKKLERSFSLNSSLAQLATPRIKAQYDRPLPERELKLRLASLRLDRNIMIKVFGWDPDREGY